MKKVIKASTSEKVYRLVQYLEDEDISERELFDYFLSAIPSSESLKILRDFAEMSGFDLSEFDNQL